MDAESTGDLRTKLTVQAASGELPDISWCPQSYSREFEKDGLIIDWKTVIEQDPEWKAQYSDAVWEGLTEQNGAITLAPLEAAIDSLYYNAEMFEENGWEAPETWDDFMALIPKIKTIVIAGSGIMGASFAQIFARNGYEVVLYDISSEALRRAKELIRINLDAQVEANSFSKEEAEGIFGRIQMTENKVCFGEADFVLEAIAEKIEIKHSFWKEISSLVRSDVILTSNTSGLSISEIAKAVIHPERFAGMHWVNPPHLIPLVEVIAGEQSSEEVVDKICELAKHIGQKPVKVQKDPTGFILNRLQYAVIREGKTCGD